VQIVNSELPLPMISQGDEEVFLPQTVI